MVFDISAVAPSSAARSNGTSAVPSDVPADAIPLALIGMAFKFPQGLDTADSFWEALCAARSMWSQFPPSRLNFDGVYDADEERLNSVCLIQW